jgi:hypothetical protein|tara:strand:- start:487 stop:789 length:303 start_codon:yes stop_codon:yes gene_type:complete
MVDLKKTTEVKVGDVISFYLFGNLVKGRAYIIKEWNFERGIEIGIEYGGSYPGEWGVGEFRPYKYLARTFIKLPKKKKDCPPWYIIAENPQIRKKVDKKK